MTETRQEIDEGHVLVICDHDGTTETRDGDTLRCSACGSVWEAGLVPGEHRRIEAA